jgi:hypothetical protein
MEIRNRHTRRHATAGERLRQAEQRPGDPLANDGGRHVVLPEVTAGMSDASAPYRPSIP